MPDIVIHNETRLDLPLWVLEDIKLEVVEYFGERVRNIRVQSGIARHTYNYKTGDVRYAFFLHDHEACTPETRTDISEPSLDGRHSIHSPYQSPSDGDQETEADDTVLALIDEEFDEIDADFESSMPGLDSDFDEMESPDLPYLRDDSEDE